MIRRSSRLVLAASFACVVALAFTSVAPAGKGSTKTYKTKTTVFKTDSGFAGKISSKKAKCIKDRTLKVGIFMISGPAAVHSDSHGNWEYNGHTVGAGNTVNVGIYPSDAGHYLCSDYTINKKF